MAIDRVTLRECATYGVPVLLGEEFEVSTHRRKSPVGSALCLTELLSSCAGG